MRYNAYDLVGCLHYIASIAQLAMQTIWASFSCSCFFILALQLVPEILFLAIVSSMSHYLSVVLLLADVSLLLHYLPRVPLFVVVLPKLGAYLLLEVPFPVTTFSKVHFLPVVELF